MRILIINQYYHPDIAATAQLCADLAEDLVRLGHRVTAVAGTAAYRTPHDGAAALPPAPLRLRDEHRGVRIVRVPVPALDATGILGRALGYLSFLGGALARVITEERPDVVLALSTPPLVAALALVPQALRGCRFVYWVQDVYPDLAVRMGLMRAGGLPARAFAALSRLLYRRADAVVALDEAMGERLRAQGARRVRVIDNWCDEAEVTPQPPAQNRLRQALGLGARFTVGYAGNLGRGHDFATVADALRLLRDDPIEWVFIGGGPRLEPLRRAAQDLPRVHFLPPQSRAGLRDALTAGDVGLVTMEEGLEGLLVPSKIYGMLAAGRPVLYVGPPAGRIAEVLAAEEVGESVRNHDAGGLAAAVRRLAAAAERRVAMGARARDLFERRFTRAQATARHAAALAEVAGRGGEG